MGIYARPSWRMLRQILGDLFIVAWGLCWYYAAKTVYEMIMLFSAPARTTADAGKKMREQIHNAAEQAGRLPAVGNDLRSPFDGLAGQVDKIVQGAQQQITMIEQTALVCCLVTFLVPVVLVLWWWLPQRIEFIKRRHAALALVDNSADLELFALRAMATQPMREIAKITADPVGQWRAGNAEVISKLADLELAESGLSLSHVLKRRR